MSAWLDKIEWNADGLVPAIAQDALNGDVLMLAWMSRESLEHTLSEGEAVYWSRSRGRLWKKGEQSGHVQRVTEIRLDCDADALLLRVVQEGGVACHTGRRRCFYRQLQGAGDVASWVEVDPVLRDPASIYGRT